MNRYPLWRYLLMIAIIVFGVIYALPNIYGEDPAIQVTTKEGAALPMELVNNVRSVLQAQKIPFISAEGNASTNTILIRFNHTEDQLKAQDIVEATVGSQYSVALNLAAKTPAWLRAIGAKPMRLGLDLSGGIHFLMQVDTQAMQKERLTADQHAMGSQLQSSDVRYGGIIPSGNSLSIRFRDNVTRDQGLRVLKQNFSEYDYSEIKGSGDVSATLQKVALEKLEQEAVSQNITTLDNRVNALGVAEPVILQQGRNQISVDLPGVQDMARAKDMIGKVATIRLQLVDVEHDTAQAASTGIVPFGSTLYRYEGQPYLLKNQVLLSGKSILNAMTIMGEDGRPAVSIRTGGSAVSFFNKTTSENIGKPLAVVYVETQIEKKIVDGKVVTTPKQIERVINVATIQSALGNNFQVTGLSSVQYAQDLSLLLRSGAYSAPVSFISERLVGPSLGKENIQMGVLSCEVAAFIIVIFMAFYYRLFGLVANFALILNLILLIAIMSVLGFTLTLPGIAGIVLTVGMAIDANVLINERIREELRSGMSPQASIHAGYARAFSTIVDANVSTLIVAAVLYALGTGAVQGLAVTLAIGLLISMVTAIFFTRAIVNLIYGRRVVKTLSIGIKLSPKTA
jgi:preprotein translocase subunit SecD